MTHRMLAAALLLALATPLSANDAPSITKSYSFRVEVDNQGKVVEAEPVTEVPAPLLDTLSALVQKSEFDPAQVDGRPVPSLTTVHVVMRFEGEGQEVRAVPVQLLSGGRLDNGTPPVYPYSQARGKVAAMVWATLSFHADGSLDREASRIDSVDVAFDSPHRRKGNHEKSFRSAVEAAMMKWTLVPDEVDGKPIAMTVRVPTRFCPNLRIGACDEMWANAAEPEPAPVPRDADVRLAKIKPTISPVEGG